MKYKSIRLLTPLLIFLGAFVSGVGSAIAVALHIADRSWEGVQSDAKIIGDPVDQEFHDEFLVNWALSNIERARESDVEGIIKVNCVLLEGWTPNLNPDLWTKPAKRKDAEALVSRSVTTLKELRKNGLCLTAN